MANPAKPAVNPIALKQGEGEALWFFGGLVIVKASGETTAGRVTVIEHLAPEGYGPPVTFITERMSGSMSSRRIDLLGWRQDHRGTDRVVRVWTARHPPHFHSHVATSAQPCGHPSLPASKSSCARWANQRRHTRFRRRAFRCRAATESWQQQQSSARNTRPARHPFLAEPSCPDGVVTSPPWDTSVPPTVTAIAVAPNRTQKSSGRPIVLTPPATINAR